MMIFPPSLADAQPANTAQKVPSKPKPMIDLGYVTPETTAAVVAYPRRILTAPEMEMLPVEAIRAVVKSEWGIDPLEIEQLVIIAKATDEMPGGAMVLKMTSPVGEGRILGPVWDGTVEDKLDGRTYRRGADSAALSILLPNERTLLLVSNIDLLAQMLHNHAKPQEGPMTRALAHVREPPDVLAIFLTERMPGAVCDLLRATTMPRAAAERLSHLVASVEARANLTNSVPMSLVMQATNTTAAKQLEDAIDAGLTIARRAIAVEAANQATSNDPVEQALSQYAKRASEQMLQALRPVRKAETFTLAGTGKMPQTATMGAVMVMLLPTMRTSDDARQANSVNDLKQAGLALRHYFAAQGQFPFKAMFLDLIRETPTDKERPAESSTDLSFLAHAFSGDPSVQVLRFVVYCLGFMALSSAIQYPISKLRRRKCKGFTIIELLIVITIVGILMGLLLPAVQAAREAARKTQCQNNLRQLGLALQNYHSLCGAFPPAINLPAGEIEATTTKWKENWVITILPFMDNQPLHNEFDLTKPISDPVNRIPRGQKLSFMLCPSDTGSDVLYSNGIEGENWARGNYAANGSIANNELGTLTLPPPGVPASYAQNGVNWALPWVPGVMGCNGSLRAADIKDGLSNTVLLGEIRIGVSTLDRRGTWAMGSAGASSLFGHGVGRDMGPNVSFPDNLLGCKALQDSMGGRGALWSECMACWEGEGSSKAAMRSQHAGGVFTCFCDGSVHWLSNNIDHGSNREIPGTRQAQDPDNNANPNPPTANDYHVWERLNCSADGFPVDGTAF